MNAPAMSHAAMRELGWQRVDPRPWGKCGAEWDHNGGWKLRHCGHQTALTPWTLYAPDGTEIRAPNGKHWPNLRAASTYVFDSSPSPIRAWADLTEDERQAEAKAARAAAEQHATERYA